MGQFGFFTHTSTFLLYFFADLGVMWEWEGSMQQGMPASMAFWILDLLSAFYFPFYFWGREGGE
jgi:hypothetical protein